MFKHVLFVLAVLFEPVACESYAPLAKPGGTIRATPPVVRAGVSAPPVPALHLMAGRQRKNATSGNTTSTTAAATGAATATTAATSTTAAAAATPTNTANSGSSYTTVSTVALPAPVKPSPAPTKRVPDMESSDIYILTIQQGDPACPSARACPGQDALETLCKGVYTNFECSSAWSSGMVGTYIEGVDAGEPRIQSAFRDASVKLCAQCATTITLFTVQDSPLH